MKVTTKFTKNYIYNRKDSSTATFVLFVEAVTTAEAYGNSTIKTYDLNTKRISVDSFSPISETHIDFDNEEDYAFYEIGHKDDYPEYLL